MRIRVEDPSIDWLSLEPQSDRKDVVITEGGTPRTVGTTSEEITLVEVEGVPALRRTQAMESEVLGDRETATVVFRDGFLPFSHLDVTDEYTLSVAYRGTRVAGRKELANGETIFMRADLAIPVFDAHSVEVVLRVLPLVDGYIAEVPVFHAGRGREMVVVAQVFGRETLLRSGESVDAWKVKTDWNGVTQYYWIGVETRALLLQSSELSDGIRLEFVT